MQSGDYEAAEAAFTECIGDGEKASVEGTSEDADQIINDAAYYYRAVCRTALGNTEGALADYTVCIDHGYELSQCYYQRAQIYAAMGDTDKQSEDLAQSLKYAE
jgi:tetratricopeptide (TPR) repeat protein